KYVAFRGEGAHNSQNRSDCVEILVHPFRFAPPQGLRPSVSGGNPMNRRKSSLAMSMALAIVAFTLFCACGAKAQTYKILHNFGPPGDGTGPLGALVFDRNGNLYGTTSGGGASNSICGLAGCGTVFELMPNSDGSWTEEVLHRFNGSDGVGPSDPLVL